MKNGKRDYATEYAKYHSRDEQKKNRAGRNKAHKMVEKKIGHKTSKDVGHKRAMSKGGVTTLANIFVQSASNNRSFARNKDGSMKSETSKRERQR